MARRYRLLAGQHIQTDTDGKERKHVQGEVFESEQDLLHHNAMGMRPKFEQVDRLTPIGFAQAPQQSSSVATANLTDKEFDTLKVMSVDELKKWSKEEEINLGTAKTKEEILKTIKEQVAE